MLLHEEYILRHQLNVQIIRLDPLGSVFLRSVDRPFRWSIFSFRWRDGQIHPGVYDTQEVEPVRNSFDEKHFFRQTFSKQVHVDSFESLILTFATSCKRRNLCAIPVTERSLAVWQIFLTIYDKWLAQHMNADFFRLVEESTRLDFDVNRRQIASRNAYSMLNSFPKILDVLSNQLLLLTSGHAEWLEKVING